MWSRGEGASRSTRSAPPFPTGHGFIEAVPQLAQDLAGKLQVNAQAFDGSVDSLEYIDKAARRLGGQNCLDDPTILGPIIAYVGEAMREVTQGRWEIRSWDSHGGEDCDRWQPVVLAANGREYHPIGIFKELLERGSVWARVEFDLGGQLIARREEVRRPATGALGDVPQHAYMRPARPRPT